jgi:hypothetical protein
MISDAAGGVETGSLHPGRHVGIGGPDDLGALGDVSEGDPVGRRVGILVCRADQVLARVVAARCLDITGQSGAEDRLAGSDLLQRDQAVAEDWPGRLGAKAGC